MKMPHGPFIFHSFCFNHNNTTIMKKNWLQQIIGIAAAVLPLTAMAQSITNTVSFGGRTFTDFGLVGIGRLAHNSTDYWGETLGSFSAISFDPGSWRKSGNTYTGTLWTMADRGYNTDVFFSDYRTRMQNFTVNFTPYTGTANTSDQNQVSLTYNGSASKLLTYGGTNFTGLNATSSTTLYGMASPFVTSNSKVTVDAEGLAILKDGSFYLSDEYGPAVYYFNSSGQLQGQVAIPNSIRGKDNSGNPLFTSIEPKNNAAHLTGRGPNQGLEGVAVSPDGRTLVTMTQSAVMQDSASDQIGKSYKQARLLVYDISSSKTDPTLSGHYVVELPIYSSTKVARQSDIIALSATKFLVIAREGIGLGGDSGASIKKDIILVDISAATNLKDPVGGINYNTTTNKITTSVAKPGALISGITAATSSSYINMLTSSQLGKFGMTSDTTRTTNSLSEKFEGMALVPVLDPTKPNDYFLFVSNDNDFNTPTISTRDINGVATTVTNANSGAASTIDNMLLVYRLTLPGYVDRGFVAAAESTVPTMAAGRLSYAINPARALQAQVSARAMTQRTKRLNGLESWDLEDGTMLANAATGDVSKGWDVAGDSLGNIQLARRADNRFGAFLQGSFLKADQNAIGSDLGFTADQTQYAIGLDYRLSDKWLGVLALGRMDQSAKLSDDIGQFESSSWTLTPSLSYLGDQFHMNAGLNYSRLTYDNIKRDAGFGTVADAETRGSHTGIYFSSGYDMTWNRLIFTPTVGLNKSWTTIDGYTETGAGAGNLILEKQTIDSTTSNLGMQISRFIPTTWGGWVPHVRGEWVHEFEDGRRLVTASFVEDATLSMTNSTGTPDRDYMTFGAGLRAVSRKGWEASLEYQTILGRTGYSSHGLFGQLALSF